MTEQDHRAANNTSVNKDAPGFATTKHMNELDISKIVAQKYAKNA
jgi:hypothetical protein